MLFERGPISQTVVFQGGFFCLGRSFPFPSLIGFFPSFCQFCQALAEDRVTTPTKKKKIGLQSVTAWIKTILCVRDLTSCHTPISKQRANNIGILHTTVHSATDSQHAVIVGVQKGALLIQRAKLCLLPACRDVGLVIQQIEQLRNVRR